MEVPDSYFGQTIREEVVNDEGIFEAILYASGLSKSEFYKNFYIDESDKLEVSVSSSDYNYGGAVYKVYKVRSEGNKIRRDLLRIYRDKDVIKIIDYLVKAKKQGGENKGEQI